MSDRELLELAAKAAGVGIDDWNGDTPVEYFWDGDPQNPERNYRYWNPLNDDGDALRLAVALGKQYLLYLEIGRSGADVEFDSHNAQAFERGDDAAAATRRAIVRAAAEIGKQI